MPECELAPLAEALREDGFSRALERGVARKALHSDPKATFGVPGSGRSSGARRQRRIQHIPKSVRRAFVGLAANAVTKLPQRPLLALAGKRLFVRLRLPRIRETRIVAAVVFVALTPFVGFRSKYWTDEDLRALHSFLLVALDAGDLIRGGAGLRKLRWSAQGRGKRGGARVIY